MKNLCKKAVLVLTLVFVSCCRENYSQNNTGKTVEPSPEKSQKAFVTWREVPLPISGLIFADGKNKLMIVGEDGLASLEQDDKAIKLPPLKIAAEYKTKDGGISKSAMQPLKQFPGDEKSYPYVCSPDNATFFGEKLYVFALCEHAAQLWKVNFEGENTKLSILDLTSGDVEAGDESVLGPTRLPASNVEKVLLPSFVKEGPALLTEDAQKNVLKVVWQGKPEDGGISGLDFVGDVGWMFLSGGKLFRSSDGGVTWQFFSELPPEARSNISRLKFRNQQEGYAVGIDGSIFSTVDSGKTWIRKSSGVDTSLYKIAVSEDLVAVCGSYGTLLINKKGESDWIKINNKPEGDVTDLLFYKGKLYILVGEKLFVGDLS